MPSKQILVVAPPGRLQEGLQVLLATIPGTAVVVVAEAAATAAQGAGEPPRLVIAAGHKGERVVRALRDAYPAAHLLFLVEHTREIVAAEAAGADTAVVEGTPAGHLMDIVRCLLVNASDDPLEVNDDSPTRI